MSWITRRRALLVPIVLGVAGAIGLAQTPPPAVPFPSPETPPPMEAPVQRQEVIVVRPTPIAAPALIQRAYEINDLLPMTDRRYQPLVELVTRTVAPKTWCFSGGPGTIDYFPLGMVLVINQTSEVHAQVAALFAGMQHARESAAARVKMEEKLTGLLKTYDDACEERDFDVARKAAREALEIDPACFSRKKAETSAPPLNSNAGNSLPR